MVSKAIDTLIVFRILRLLTKKWNQQAAYKEGIIDDKGKPLKKSSELTTTREKNSYTILHRLVFNLKRIIEKLPFGKLKLTSYIAALALIKEHVEDKAGEFTAKRLMESIEGRMNTPKVLYGDIKKKHDMSTKEGYLAAVEDALLEITSVAGAVNGIAGIDNSRPPETLVVPKKRDKKRGNPILNFVNR